MKITKTSNLTGNINTRDINITCDEYDAFLAEMEDQDGRTITQMFPKLSDDEREFLLTGGTAEEWDELFNSDDFDDFSSDVFSDEYT